MSDSTPPGVLTVIENIYHQLPGEQPSSFGGDPEQHGCIGDDDPYSRTYKKPSTIEFGWIKQPGMIYIRNLMDSNLSVEREDGTEFAYIPPRASFRGWLNGKLHLALRPGLDSVRAVVVVFPK